NVTGRGDGELRWRGRRHGGPARPWPGEWRRRFLSRYVLQPLEFHEGDRLRLSVFGHEEILRGQSLDDLPLLVLHADGFDHQPRAAPKCDRTLGVRWQGLLRTTCWRAEREEAHREQESTHRQNLRRRLVCTFRMGLASVGRPNC